MRGAVIHAAGDVRIENRDDPAIIKPERAHRRRNGRFAVGLERFGEGLANLLACKGNPLAARERNNDRQEGVGRPKVADSHAFRGRRGRSAGSS